MTFLFAGMVPKTNHNALAVPVGLRPVSDIATQSQEFFEAVGQATDRTSVDVFMLVIEEKDGLVSSQQMLGWLGSDGKILPNARNIGWSGWPAGLCPVDPVDYDTDPRGQAVLRRTELRQHSVLINGLSAELDG